MRLCSGTSGRRDIDKVRCKACTELVSVAKSILMLATSNYMETFLIFLNRTSKNDRSGPLEVVATRVRVCISDCAWSNCTPYHVFWCTEKLTKMSRGETAVRCSWYFFWDSELLYSDHTRHFSVIHITYVVLCVLSFPVTTDAWFWGLAYWLLPVVYQLVCYSAYLLYYSAWQWVLIMGSVFNGTHASAHRPWASVYRGTMRRTLLVVLSRSCAVRQTKEMPEPVHHQHSGSIASCLAQYW